MFYDDIKRGDMENNIVIRLIGDSITAGAGSLDDNRNGEVIINIDGICYKRQLGEKCWASLFKKYINERFKYSKVINNGCSGINSSQVKDNLNKLYDMNDNIIILMIGANDRKVNNGMKILHSNLISIVENLLEKDKKIILMTPNPVTAQDDNYDNRLYKMNEVVNVIREVSKYKGIKCIDNYEYINMYLKNRGQTIEELMNLENGDGLHPTDTIHKLIFKNIIRNYF